MMPDAPLLLTCDAVGRMLSMSPRTVRFMRAASDACCNRVVKSVYLCAGFAICQCQHRSTGQRRIVEPRPRKRTWRNVAHKQKTARFFKSRRRSVAVF